MIEMFLSALQYWIQCVHKALLACAAGLGFSTLALRKQLYHRQPSDQSKARNEQQVTLNKSGLFVMKQSSTLDQL